MKKIVSVICLAIISFLLFPAPVSADEVKENLPLKACSTGVLGKTSEQPFQSGTGGSKNFRIPALIELSNGWLVAAADARWGGVADAGGLDTMVSISKDGGKTWEYQFPLYMPDSADFKLGDTTTIIDPVLMKGKNDRIYLMTVVQPTGTAGAYFSSEQYGHGPGDGSGYVMVEGVERLALTSKLDNVVSCPTDENKDDYEFYVGDFIGGYAPVINRKSGIASEYIVDDWYNIYQKASDGSYTIMTQKQVDKEDVDIQQNVFYHGSTLHVYDTIYNWLATSDDMGMTWNYQILNPQLRRMGELFSTSPGKGFTNGDDMITIGGYVRKVDTVISDHANFIFSKDYGKTWVKTPTVPVESNENELLELPDGTLRMFLRTPKNNAITYCDAVWNEEQQNYEWGDVTVTDVSCTSDCNVTALMYSKPINGKPAILVACPDGEGSRTKGTVFTFLLNDDGTMELLNQYKVTEGTYQYSSMVELDDGMIGLLWENGTASIRYDNYSIKALVPEAEIGGVIERHIPLYGSVSLCVLGAVKPDNLSEFNSEIASVSDIQGEIFTFTGIRAGDTQFTVNGTTYVLHVDEPSADRLTESTLNVNESRQLESDAEQYVQYGDSVTVERMGSGNGFLVKGVKAGVTDIVIGEHIYRYTVSASNPSPSGGGLSGGGTSTGGSSSSSGGGTSAGGSSSPSGGGTSAGGSSSLPGSGTSTGSSSSSSSDSQTGASGTSSQDDKEPNSGKSDATELEIPQTSGTISSIGKSITLEIKGVPEGTEVEWSSSDPTVAVVDDGVVKAVGNGTVVITAKAGDKTVTYTVTVSQRTEKVAISLNGQDVGKKLTVTKGKSYKLQADVSPSNTAAQNAKVTWTTSNKKIATVSKKGVVKIRGIGTVRITAETADGKKQTVTLKATVKTVHVSKVSVTGKKTMKKGKKQTLTADVFPLTAANQKLVWKTSDKKVATVSQKGVVTAKKKGKVTITVVSKDGKKKAVFKITVK